MFAAALPAIASAAVGAMSYLGGRQRNADQLKASREQMAFQERMSNTSWQRGVEDMRKAGINPMLAFSQGGASAPQGASPDYINPASDFAGNVTRGISSAVQAQLVKGQLDQIDANIAKTKADIDKTKVDTLTSAKLGSMYDQQKDLNSAQAALTRTNNQLNRFDLPEKKNQSTVSSSFAGVPLAVAERILPLLNPLTSAFSAVKSATNMSKSLWSDVIHPSTGEVMSSTRSYRK